MKRLQITYDGNVMFDAEVIEFQWTDADNGVQVIGKTRKQANLLEALAAARKPDAEVIE